MPGARVMIVEDEPIIGLQLKSCLTKLNYDVVAVARSGEDALQKVTHCRPEIVLMDIHLDGEMDGIETAARLLPNCQAPVVYLTGNFQPGLLDRAGATNAYGYLSKPYSERDLHATLQLALVRFAAHLAAENASALLRSAKQDADAAKVEADMANRAKTEFLSHMSHELRTPLNAILGFSEIMAMALFGPIDERYRSYASDIFTSGTHLLELVNEILDLSKLDAKQVELVDETVDLKQIIESSIKFVEIQAQKAGIHISTDAYAHHVSLRVDARRMRQILINLLSNAVKFTPEGGDIFVSTFARDGGIVIVVNDTGIGIAATDIPKALEPFGQVERMISRNYQGTGLGLPLANHLMALHGGTLTLNSALGVGTKVTLFLPADRVVH